MFCKIGVLNPLSANFTQCSNTLKQFVGKLQANCLSVFDSFVGLALKGLRTSFLQNTSGGSLFRAEAATGGVL